MSFQAFSQKSILRVLWVLLLPQIPIFPNFSSDGVKKDEPYIDLPTLSMQQISSVSTFLYERATKMPPSVQHVRGRLNLVAFKKHIYRDKSSKLFLYISFEKSISQGVNCRI